MLVAANLVPLAGVLFFGWSTFATLLLFWVENVIVGGFNVLRMLWAQPDNPLIWVAKAGTIPFFIIHYGLFTTVHGVFVLISSDNRPGGQGMGLFLESEHIFVKPFSLDGLLDQVETIARRTGHNVGRDDSGGPDAADRDGMLPQVPDEV